jgi:hypothetical protein
VHGSEGRADSKDGNAAQKGQHIENDQIRGLHGDLHKLTVDIENSAHGGFLFLLGKVICGGLPEAAPPRGKVKLEKLG